MTSHPVTFESTIPPLAPFEPLFYEAGPSASVWNRKMTSTENKLGGCRLSDSPKLQKDAQKYGLSVAELDQLGSTAWLTRDKAYCMLRKSGWSGGRE